MAAKDDDSLIGFDPLAWMEGDTTTQQAEQDENTQGNDFTATSTADEIEAKIEAASAWVDNNSDETKQTSDEEMNESGNNPEEKVSDAVVSLSENDAEEHTSTELSSSQTDEAMTETVQGVDDMSPVAIQTASTHVINLEATQNIQNVSDLHQKIFAVYQQHDKIEIDASEVSSIDTSSLQLLLVLKRTAMNENKEISFDFPSERFIEAAELLGMSDMLGVDKADAGFF